MDPKLKASLVSYLVNKTGADTEFAHRLADHIEENPHYRVNQLYLDQAKQYQAQTQAQEDKIRAEGAALAAQNGIKAIPSEAMRYAQMSAMGPYTAPYQPPGTPSPAAQAYAASLRNDIGPNTGPTAQDKAYAAKWAARERSNPANAPQPGQFLQASAPVAMQLSQSLGLDPVSAADTAAKLFAPMQDIQMAHYNDKASY